MPFIDSEKGRHPLSDLDGRSIGNYRIQLQLKPLRRQKGWTHFSLFLKDQQGRMSIQRRPPGGGMSMPILEGIHSRGGKGVKGWIEVGDYFPVVYFEEQEFQAKSVDLVTEGIDQWIFKSLSEKVPPGRHLMFAYEVSYESPFHRETQKALTKGIPPICTAQGELLFRAGFRLAKDWYLSEGGYEGPRKLWGEKPFNESQAREFDLKSFFQLLGFLIRKSKLCCKDIEQATMRRSLALLGDLKLDPGLSSLINVFIQISKDRIDAGALKKAGFLSCEMIKQMLKESCISDSRIIQGLTDISRVC